MNEQSKAAEEVDDEDDEMKKNAIRVLDSIRGETKADKNKATEIVQDENSESNSKLEKLEQIIAQKLLKSANLGKNLENSEIKVKIVTIGTDSNNLNEDESVRLTEMLTSMLQGQTDKMRSLKSNYDSLYNEDNIDDLIRTQKNEKPTGRLKEKRQPIEANDFFFSLIGKLDDSDQKLSETDTDNEKLIIY